MSDAFTAILAVVKFLVAKQGLTVDEAIKAADVPAHQIEHVLEWFRDPVLVEPPALVKRNTAGLLLCHALRADEPQPYFNDLRAFLIDHRHRAREVVENIALTSEQLVCRLPVPTQPAPLAVRGLVIGHIQSGKTASMAALIARAADQGYRLFIVLAGLIDDLRVQTQRRLDQEITGRSDDERDAPFVAHDPGAPKWVRLTRSGMSGEFEPGLVQSDPNPATPKLAVIKKIPSVIEKLTRWLKESPIPLANLPALVIDDECDQASIDTNYGKVLSTGEDADPTRTNAAIRGLLAALPKRAYVGFTATPFANVLIEMDADDDLYPADFVAALPEPAGYVGPRQLFGLGMTASELSGELPHKAVLDVIRDIDSADLDALEAMTPSGSCPEKLAGALLAYILSCSARMLRGQDNDHFSMLVHPSQATASHDVYRSVLERELALVRTKLEKPKSFKGFPDSARALWDTDFKRVSSDSGAPVHEFDDVWKFAPAAAAAIEFKTLNYDAKETADYQGRPKRYVVVGGNKLSRGLTLEGLSVSFYARSSSKTYDTLLQMGRWFGYRSGYVDLTRIYVERSLAKLFADMARVEVELRADLRKYSQEPALTPRDLAPRIRAHPSMLVTSRSKMGAGKRTKAVTLADTTQATITFPVESPQRLEANLQLGRSFVRDRGEPTVADKGTLIWRGVTAPVVLEFLRAYEYGANATVVNYPTIAEYVKRLNERGELTVWDVIIPRGAPDRPFFAWTESVQTQKVERSPSLPISPSIGTLFNPNDERIWERTTGRTADDASLGGLILYIVDKSSGAPGKRFTANPEDERDLLGFVLVFPKSRTPVVVDYVTQQPTGSA